MASKNIAQVEFNGFLYGHGGAVTSIVTGVSNSDEDDTLLVSGSRDKTLIIWDLNEQGEEQEFGVPHKCLTGHNHFVTDLAMSRDNNYVISSSWDRTLRLWDIRYGKCMERFTGHTREVHTVSFSQDNRQIFSGGSEKDIRIWNTLGQCKVVCEKNNHLNWVSKIRYSSSQKNNYYASVGRDGRLKIWHGLFKLYASIKAHDNYINALALSANGENIATGGKDKNIKIWDYVNLKQALIEYKCDSEVNSLAFSTKFKWIAAALDNRVVVYNILKKEDVPLFDIAVEQLPGTEEGAKPPKSTSIAWSNNSQRLYVGCDDGVIRVYTVNISGSN